MPTYGDQKKRDMARSILPSTKKDGQKDRRRIHKKARASFRSREVGVDPEDADLISPEKVRLLEIRNFVEERRFKDKTGPFERWAERSTKDLPQEDRLSYLRSLVPASLIGEHAVSHVEWKDHFEDPVVSDLQKARSANNERYYKKADGRGDMARKLRELLLEPDGHARINRCLKRAHEPSRVFYADGSQKMVGPLHARTLRGVHDVEAFLDDLFRASRVPMTLSREPHDPRFHSKIQYGPDVGAFWIPSDYTHPEWLRALKLFLEGDRKAA